MLIKENDFVEVEYIATIKDSDFIFDLTDENLAKEKKIHQPGANYGPKIFCIGRNHILPALEQALINKEINKEYEINLTPDQGFGKKHSKLIKTIPTQQLLDQKIQPYPGLQITIEGRIGTIKSVSRGRTMIDFNNPLAGRSLTYKIKVLSIVKDNEKKLKGLVDTLLNLKDYKIENKENEFTIKTKLPKPAQTLFIKEVKECIPEISLKFS